ncbi:hypothetical protein PVAP13_2NG126900 [Panicum virgatum]|uniref:Uncharacterized protein n=1 Tax=Panicum virgatum TaxID=38727 RepID=A0A8T0VEF6_PANVG|nr:hypothetical protein PVAP13_2NG126900 [Panicum virgatum]
MAAMRHRARSSPTSPLTPSSSARTKKILGFSVSLILINLASIMERADENLLPAVYKEVSAAFNAGPTDLGYLTFLMNFLKSIASPLAGFGLLSLIGAVGGIGGSILATIMAGKDYWGFPGWRVAFMMVALVSLIIGILVYLYATDPRRIPGNHLLDDDDYERFHLSSKDVLPPPSIWRDSWVATRSVMKVKTFQIIVLQGIIGSLPWTAIVFFTMWFELIGFDNNSSAALNSLFAIGCASGAFIGGVIADCLSKHFPDSARVICAQFSAFMGIPFSWILLTVIPQSVDYWYAFAVTLFFMGITISWCATSANNPMFAEVVPPKHRTMIYAFDRAFEGSFASLAAPAVGLVTEKIYGYDAKTVNLANGSAEGAYALSRGLLTMMIVPFGVCVLFYSPLYLVFKRDRENAKLSSFKEQELV